MNCTNSNCLSTYNYTIIYSMYLVLCSIPTFLFRFRPILNKFYSLSSPVMRNDDFRILATPTTSFTTVNPSHKYPHYNYNNLHVGFRKPSPTAQFDIWVNITLCCIWSTVAVTKNKCSCWMKGANVGSFNNFIEEQSYDNDFALLGIWAKMANESSTSL